MFLRLKKKIFPSDLLLDEDFALSCKILKGTYSALRTYNVHLQCRNLALRQLYTLSDPYN